jgi:hypothetical protein
MEGRESLCGTERSPQPCRCPKCGGDVEVAVVSSGLFCGLRATASCKNGCLWDADEQLRMDAAATDFLFG